MKIKELLPTECHMEFFFVVLEHNYKLNSSSYPMISSVDMNCFKDRMTSFSNNGIGDIGHEMLYDPIMEPLVQSSLAHLLYMKKNSIPLKEYETGDKLPDLSVFHPNYIRFYFMDNLISNKASVTLGSFKHYFFSPSTACMNWDKLLQKVNELLQNPVLESLVHSFFVKELQVDGDPLNRTFGLVKTQTS